MMRRGLMYFLFFFLLASFVEFAFRSYYAFQYEDNRILMNPSWAIEKFYPSIQSARQQPIDPSDNTIDILLLGASVLHPTWGTIEKDLKEMLQGTVKQPIAIHNFSVSAHTSLDSRMKYQLLKDHSYDIVILYHGINELRFNLCPPQKFEADYSHVPFYRSIYALSSPLSQFSILPLVFSDMETIFQKDILKDTLISMNSPLIEPLDSAWLVYGTDIKTEQSFFDNYNYIIEDALKKGSAVIIPSYVFYIPTDYTPEKFSAKTLDYVSHSIPIELWGTLASVQKGLINHNNILDRINEQYQQEERFYFLNLREQLDEGHYFNDICHLSADGCKVYATELSHLIRKILDNE